MGNKELVKWNGWLAKDFVRLQEKVFGSPVPEERKERLMVAPIQTFHHHGREIVGMAGWGGRCKGACLFFT